METLASLLIGFTLLVWTWLEETKQRKDKYDLSRLIVVAVPAKRHVRSIRLVRPHDSPAHRPVRYIHKGGGLRAST